MPLILPPRGSGGWFQSIEQSLHQDDVDIKRLWQNSPQIPDGQMGVPWLGKEVADRFVLPSPPPPASSSSSSMSSCSGFGPCSACVSTPSQWSLAFSGVTNNGCFNCTTFNATWILDRTACSALIVGIDPNCQWSVITDICQPHSTPADFRGRILLYKAAGGGGWQLVVGFSTIGVSAIYNPSGVFNCATANTMSRASAATLSECRAWPSTITVTPIP